MGTLLSMEFINNHNVTGEHSIRVFLKIVFTVDLYIFQAHNHNTNCLSHAHQY